MRHPGTWGSQRGPAPPDGASKTITYMMHGDAHNPPLFSWPRSPSPPPPCLVPPVSSFACFSCPDGPLLRCPPPLLKSHKGRGCVGECVGWRRSVTQGGEGIRPRGSNQGRKGGAATHAELDGQRQLARFQDHVQCALAMFGPGLSLSQTAQHSRGTAPCIPAGAAIVIRG